ncbi:MAG: glycogen debranching N-terminal domain-containing protein [Acidimicrobiia bacterium]
MTQPWTYEGAVASNPGATVTLTGETTFCLSAANGDILPGSAQGLFFLDTRFLSQLELFVDGHPTESLAQSDEQPYEGLFVVRPTGGTSLDPAVLVFRRRVVGRGMVERIELRNYGREPAVVSVELAIGADFADLFEVKEQRAQHPLEHSVTETPMGMRFVGLPNGIPRRTTVRSTPPPDHIEPGWLRWSVELEPGTRHALCIEFTGGIDAEDVPPRFHCDASQDDVLSPALAGWQAKVAVVETADRRLSRALRRTADDLGSLRLVDPDHPDDVIIAAGAPWFMTLFGRDAILTAYMALMIDPSIALGVLRTLARLQGTRHDPHTEEQPGRILHEVRFHDRPSWKFAEGTIYYGTADATPLFVMLLGELRRWGLDDGQAESLLPAADRALEWVTRFGDRDDDGFVEYLRVAEHGLANQGWKDSWDAIRFADGRLAEGPIALCEVQGYTYAAYLARAHLAEESGDLAAMREWRERAARLRSEFRRKFWLPGSGHFALALDGEKRPVDAIASNMGHALWSGIVDEDLAPAVAQRLLAPEMFSGWGIRTMAASMGGYNPVSYHLGSVWPHDGAICAAGLTRYGFTNEAHRVIDGLLDVAEHFGGRLPELLSGIDRSELSVPAVYPTSCMPQAWAAAAPLLFVRSLLRFDPAIPRRALWVAPELPGWVDHIEIDRVCIDGRVVSVRAGERGCHIDNLASDVAVQPTPRVPIINR